MRSALPLVFALSLLTGCPTEEAADGPHCAETVSDVALDEVTPIGVSAAEVLANLPAHEDAELIYASGDRTPLALDFAAGDAARFVDLEAVYPEGGVTMDIAVVCDDYVAVDVDFDFATEDGVFAESIATELQATAETLGSIYAELDLAHLEGTFSIDDYTTVTDYDEARARVSVALHEAAATSGSFDGDVSGEDDCAGSDTCSAWDVGVPIGTWGEAAE